MNCYVICYELVFHDTVLLTTCFLSGRQYSVLVDVVFLHILMLLVTKIFSGFVHIYGTEELHLIN